jgi:hypothetical protein
MVLGKKRGTSGMVLGKKRETSGMVFGKKRGWDRRKVFWQ